MIELLQPSSSEDKEVENADWAETSSLFKADGNVSREDLAQFISVAKGVRRETAREAADAAFREIESRVGLFGGRGDDDVACYPFKLTTSGTLLERIKPPHGAPDSGLLYIFLLLVTRADMSSDERKLAGIDPTATFESLCADVVREFWGGESEHCDAIVFGTARAAGIGGARVSVKDGVDTLCKTHLREGLGWKPTAISPKAGDGKLDIVAWKRFQDQRHGALVGFAQCKTGIHWRKHLPMLVPRNFCGDYMIQPLLIDPVRMYLVPCRIAERKWESDTRAGGILFDRFRVLQYGTALTAGVLDQCRTWTNAAIAAHKAGNNP